MNIEFLLNGIFKLLGLTEAHKAQARDMMEQAPAIIHQVVGEVRDTREQLARIEAKLDMILMKQDAQNGNSEEHPREVRQLASRRRRVVGTVGELPEPDA